LLKNLRLCDVFGRAESMNTPMITSINEALVAEAPPVGPMPKFTASSIDPEAPFSAATFYKA
jgi:hypothetical protein